MCGGICGVLMSLYYAVVVFWFCGILLLCHFDVVFSLCGILIGNHFTNITSGFNGFRLLLGHCKKNIKYLLNDLSKYIVNLVKKNNFPKVNLKTQSYKAFSLKKPLKIAVVPVVNRKLSSLNRLFFQTPRRA